MNVKFILFSLEGMVKWNFRLSDPEWGASQATNLVTKLESALKEINVSVILGKGSVEVMPQGMHSGMGLRHTVKEHLSRFGITPELYLIVGDDVTDEYMYSALYEFLDESENQSSLNAEVFTTTVISP